MRSRLLVALVPFILLGCVPPVREHHQPEAFQVAGDAALTIEGELTLNGRFEAEYFLEDGLRVDGTSFREMRIHRMQTWIHDTTIIIKRIGRDRTIPLRCTMLANNGPIRGLVDDAGQFVVSEDASIFGLSFARRDASGGCPGEGDVIAFNGSSDEAIVGRHDPAGNAFEASGRFEVEIDEEDYHGRIQLTGIYLNRPPMAVIGSIAEGLFDLSQGGCPPVTGTNPEGVDSNTPEGLNLVLQSVSYDPDGDFGRADITREQWARYWGRPGDPGVRYAFLGRGRQIGPFLFEPGQEHTVVLMVNDRRDARSQKSCTFFVRPPG